MSRFQKEGFFMVEVCDACMVCPKATGPLLPEERVFLVPLAVLSAAPLLRLLARKAKNIIFSL